MLMTICAAERDAPSDAAVANEDRPNDLSVTASPCPKGLGRRLALKQPASRNAWQYVVRPTTRL